MTSNPEDPTAAYRPFTPFAEWASTPVSTERIEARTQELESLREASPEELRKALLVVRRAAAVETGAVEGLYETDRGFTRTVAMQAATIESALAKKTSQARTLIDAQMAAYEHVLTFATSKRPIAEAWIRELHRDLCQGQGTYEVQTEAGPQLQQLPVGVYKQSENHVVTASGAVHHYAPVIETSAEMARLVRELQGPEFLSAHPILQAAYTHHAAVAVHPFADGNGRVARALASVFTYRAYSLPVLVFPDHRRTYFAALSDADRGEFEPLVEFMTQRLVDSLDLLTDSLRHVASGSRIADVNDLELLFRMPANEAAVDEQAAVVADGFARALAEVKDAETEASDPRVLVAHTGRHPPASTNARPGRRIPHPQICTGSVLQLFSQPPASATVSHSFHVEIAEEPSGRPAFEVVGTDGAVLLSLAASDISGDLSEVQRFRLSMAADRAWNLAFADLLKRAEKAERDSET